MQTRQPDRRNPMSTLRQFVRKPQQAARRALRALRARAAPPSTRICSSRPAGKLVCSCEPCASCSAASKGPVSDACRATLNHCPISTCLTSQWEDLHLPINLAFFVQSTPARRVLALYPSPAGAVESLLTLEAWQALVEQNPVLDAASSPMSRHSWSTG